MTRPAMATPPKIYRKLSRDFSLQSLYVCALRLLIHIFPDLREQSLLFVDSSGRESSVFLKGNMVTTGSSVGQHFKPGESATIEVVNMRSIHLP